MAKKTLREKLASNLEARGYTCVEKTHRTWVYQGEDKNRKFFLGASGGVRVGRIKSRSRSLTYQLRRHHPALKCLWDGVY